MASPTFINQTHGQSSQAPAEASGLSLPGILHPEASTVLCPLLSDVAFLRSLITCAVFLLARDEQRLAALQSELQQKHKVDVKFASFDFAAPDVFGRAAAALSSVGIGNVSVLINNVGYLSDIPEPYLEHSREYTDRVISVRRPRCEYPTPSTPAAQLLSSLRALALFPRFS